MCAGPKKPEVVFRTKQLYAAFQETKSYNPVSLFSAALYAGVLSLHGHGTFAIGWAVLFLGALAFRFWAAQRFLSNIERSLRSSSFWIRSHRLGLALTSGSWGLGVAHYCFFPADAHSSFTIPMLVVMSGGIAIATTASRTDFLIYTCPTLVPVALALALSEDLDRMILSVLVLGFLYFGSDSVSRFNKILLSSYQRRYEVELANAELARRASQIKALQGLLPICAVCKSIRDKDGSWSNIEHFIASRSEAEFSHGICPKCSQRYYGELLDEQQRNSIPPKT